MRQVRLDRQLDLDLALGLGVVIMVTRGKRPTALLIVCLVLTLVVTLYAMAIGALSGMR